MSDNRDYHVHVELARQYEFVASFPDLQDAPGILLDEPPPLGDDRAPNAAAILSAAVGNCLAGSLAFCLRRMRVNIENLAADVTTHVERNSQGRLRIANIDVTISPTVTAADASRLDRCALLFEDFCTVTGSVRQGIPVHVTLKPATAAEPRVA